MPDYQSQRGLFLFKTEIWIEDSHCTDFSYSIIESAYGNLIIQTVPDLTRGLLALNIVKSCVFT